MSSSSCSSCCEMLWTNELATSLAQRMMHRWCLGLQILTGREFHVGHKAAMHIPGLADKSPVSSHKVEGTAYRSRKCCRHGSQHVNATYRPKCRTILVSSGDYRPTGTVRDIYLAGDETMA